MTKNIGSSKRLQLSKETLRSLTNGELGAVMGASPNMAANSPVLAGASNVVGDNDCNVPVGGWIDGKASSVAGLARCGQVILPSERVGDPIRHG